MNQIIKRSKLLVSRPTRLNDMILCNNGSETCLHTKTVLPTFCASLTQYVDRQVIYTCRLTYVHTYMHTYVHTDTRARAHTNTHAHSVVPR
jgi:hypothetical protein